MLTLTQVLRNDRGLLRHHFMELGGRVIGIESKQYSAVVNVSIHNHVPRCLKISGDLAAHRVITQLLH